MPLVVSGKPFLPFYKLLPEVLDILAKYTASLRLMTHLTVVHNDFDLPLSSPSQSHDSFKYLTPFMQLA